MASELKQARYALNRRLASFKSRGMTSAAAIEYLGTGGMKPVKSTKSRSEKAQDIRRKDPSQLTRNQMYLELARIQSFFQAKTSTIKGQAEVNRAQDIAIFGEDERGNPRFTMSQSQREQYWSVYMEFYNQHKSMFSKTGTSESVQKILGNIQVKGALDPNRLQDMIDMVKSKLDQEENKKRQMNRREKGRSANVRRGRRNSRGR